MHTSSKLNSIMVLELLNMDIYLISCILIKVFFLKLKDTRWIIKRFGQNSLKMHLKIKSSKFLSDRMGNFFNA